MIAPSFKPRTAGFGCALLLSLIPAAQAACQRGALDIPVQIEQQRPIVQMKINGHELPMLLDTGAYFSHLLRSTAAELKLPQSGLRGRVKTAGYTGSTENESTRVKEVDLHGLVVRNVDFVVGGNELGRNFKGYLGRNLLSAADAEYDLGRGLLRLIFPKDCSGSHPAYWAQGTADVSIFEAALKSSPEDPALLIDVRINGHDMRALLDSGAPVSALTQAAANRAGIARQDMKLVGITSGAGQGSASRWMAPLAQFELGEHRITSTRIAVDEVQGQTHDILLGLDFFLSHRIYVSRGRRMLYATWNGGPVFDKAAPAPTEVVHGKALEPKVAADDAGALARHAAAALARGDAALALQQIERAIQAAPQNASYRMGQARAFQANHQPASALQALDHSLRLDPGMHEARLLRAELRWSQKLQDAALEDLRAIDQVLAADAPLRVQLAQGFERLGLLPEAVRQWDRLLSNPGQEENLASALYTRCWLRTRWGQELAQAQQDCEHAIKQDSRQWAYQSGLGWVQLRLGDANKALQAFDRAMELGGHWAWTWFGRSAAHGQLGNAAAAQADMAQARALNPEIDAQVAKAGLAALARTDSQ